MDKQDGWKIYLKDLLACPVHVMNWVNQGFQEIQRRVTELDYKLFKLHGCSIDSKETLLHVIAKEMMFPDSVLHIFQLSQSFPASTGIKELGTGCWD